MIPRRASDFDGEPTICDLLDDAVMVNAMVNSARQLDPSVNEQKLRDRFALVKKVLREERIE